MKCAQKLSLSISSVMLIAGLSACEMPEPVDPKIRESAFAVVSPAISEALVDVLPAEKAPGAASCVLDNASLEETQQLAQGSIEDPSPETYALIFVIAQRPRTISCLEQNSA